jgi:hypothetical protein
MTRFTTVTIPDLVANVPKVQPISFKPIFFDLASEGVVYPVDELKLVAGVKDDVEDAAETTEGRSSVIGNVLSALWGSSK